MSNLLKHKLYTLFGKYLLLGNVILLSGCGNEQIVFHDFHSFSTEIWAQHDIIDFYVKIPDPSETYSLYIEVRKNNLYPYRNLPLSICCVGNDSVLLNDTLQLTSNKGKYWSSKGLGRLHQMQSDMRTLAFNHTDSNRITLSYLLPNSLLKGINNIGIRIEKNKDE